MIVKDLYDRVNAVVGVSQEGFLTSLNEALFELCAKYGEASVFRTAKGQDITSVNDEVDVFDEWRAALIHYAVYSKNGDTVRYEKYEQSGDYAYRTVWLRRLGKRRRFHVPTWR